MTQPLNPPQFTASYNVGLTDIGSGYAKGITSAGQSLASAIGSILGSVNPETGEVREGVLQQGQSAQNMIDIYHKAGLFNDDVYAKLKTSSLGAQQKTLGAYTGALTAKYQSDLDLNRQMKLQQAQEAAAMARTQVSESGALERQRIASQTKEDVAANKAKQPNPLIRNAPAPNQQQPNATTGGNYVPIPPTLSLRTGY